MNSSFEAHVYPFEWCRKLVGCLPLAQEESRWLRACSPLVFRLLARNHAKTVSLAPEILHFAQKSIEFL